MTITKGMDIEWDYIHPVGEIARGKVIRIVGGMVRILMQRRNDRGKIVKYKVWFYRNEAYRLRPARHV